MRHSADVYKVFDNKYLFLSNTSIYNSYEVFVSKLKHSGDKMYFGNNKVFLFDFSITTMHIDFYEKFFKYDDIFLAKKITGIYLYKHHHIFRSYNRFGVGYF